MAFIGLLLVMLGAAVAVLIIGITPIIVGTILYKKTKHKKLGLTLRIFGYIMLIPVFAVGIIIITANFIK
ncbi:MAG: hypothetical protein E7497_05410 [Ruminococcus sp.]|nr:hypothetical protein [Ruminococcus sp.]